MLADRLVSIYAPFSCLVCAQEGSALCAHCASSVIQPKRSTCWRCNRLTENWRVCMPCAPRTKLKGVIVASHYEGVVKQLIKRLKYYRSGAIASDLARILASRIDKTQFDLVTWVPSATSRLRRRGYNPAALIAKALARRLNLPYCDSLVRLGQTRQVGTTRAEQLHQISGNIYVSRPHLVSSKRLLVVDDVITTGATLNEAAKTLRQAGAKSVWGAAAAKH